MTQARVRDVMTTDVITVARATPYKEIAARLRKSLASPAPADLWRLSAACAESRHKCPFRGAEALSGISFRHTDPTHPPKRALEAVK